MDRLISENKVLEAIDNLKANFTCYDSVTLDEVASHVKAILSADPYKGMTNGEVIDKLFPEVSEMLYDNVFTHLWWYSPYEPQESEG